MRQSYSYTKLRALLLTQNYRLQKTKITLKDLFFSCKVNEKYLSVTEPLFEMINLTLTSFSFSNCASTLLPFHQNKGIHFKWTPLLLKQCIFYRPTKLHIKLVWSLLYEIATLFFSHTKMIGWGRVWFQIVLIHQFWYSMCMYHPLVSALSTILTSQTSVAKWHLNCGPYFVSATFWSCRSFQRV